MQRVFAETLSSLGDLRGQLGGDVAALTEAADAYREALSEYLANKLR